MHEDIPLEEFKETLLQYMFQDEEIIKYELTPDDIKKIEENKRETICYMGMELWGISSV